MGLKAWSQPWRATAAYTPGTRLRGHRAGRGRGQYLSRGDHPGRNAAVGQRGQRGVVTGLAVACVDFAGLPQNGTNDPFHAVNDVLKRIKAKVIVVDFHAEATSEKVAMGWHLDGRVTAVLGTHTHIPTADERVLPGGTAYQTDVGMSGPYDSVIGVEKELVLHRFLTGMPGKFEAAKGNPKLCAALVGCDAKTGRAFSIQRIMLGE